MKAAAIYRDLEWGSVQHSVLLIPAAWHAQNDCGDGTSWLSGCRNCVLFIWLDLSSLRRLFSCSSCNLCPSQKSGRQADIVQQSACPHTPPPCFQRIQCE